MQQKQHLCGRNAVPVQQIERFPRGPGAPESEQMQCLCIRMPPRPPPGPLLEGPSEDLQGSPWPPIVLAARKVEDTLSTFGSEAVVRKTNRHGHFIGHDKQNKKA